MTIEELLKAYENELKKLVEINDRNDFSAAGDAEFLRQRETVKTAKEAIIRAQCRQKAAAR